MINNKGYLFLLTLVVLAYATNTQYLLGIAVIYLALASSMSVGLYLINPSMFKLLLKIPAVNYIAKRNANEVITRLTGAHIAIVVCGVVISKGVLISLI